MLAIGRHIRYRITPILVPHWEDFFQSQRGLDPSGRDRDGQEAGRLPDARAGVSSVRVFVGPRLPSGAALVQVVFLSDVRQAGDDRWADGVLNDLLDVPYHHLVLSPPWPLRAVISFNRKWACRCWRARRTPASPSGRPISTACAWG